MGFLKLILWTAGAVALGVFISTHKVHGQTPLETAEHTWHQTVTPQRVSAVKQRVEDAYEDAKDKVASNPAAPHEHHSAQDRQAINKLIAERSTKK